MEMSNTGLSSLRQIKKVLERRELKNFIPADQNPKFSKPIIDTSTPIISGTVPISWSTVKDNKFSDIDSQIMQNKASSVRGSIGLKELLISQDNEYTKAIKRIESLKKTALIESCNNRKILLSPSQNEYNLEIPKFISAKPNNRVKSDFFISKHESELKDLESRNDLREPTYENSRDAGSYISNKNEPLFCIADAQNNENDEILKNKKQIIELTKELRELKRENEKEEQYELEKIGENVDDIDEKLIVYDHIEQDLLEKVSNKNNNENDIKIIEELTKEHKNKIELMNVFLLILYKENLERNI